MTWLDLVLMLLATVGMCHILVDGSIFAPFRDWLARKQYTKLQELFSCYLCTGWWSGIVIALLHGLSLVQPLFLPIKLAFYVGCAGAFVSTLGAVLINFFNLAATKSQ